MERRVLVAIFLSFLVLYAYQAFFVKPVPQGEPTANTAGSPSTPAPTPSAPASPPPDAGAVQPQGETVEERDVNVESQDVSAVFTNRGARLKSWRLKHYQDQNREPLELVATDLAASHPMPFSVAFDDAALSDAVNHANYDVVASTPTRVVFQRVFETTTGRLAITKEFNLASTGYVVNVNAIARRQDRPENADTSSWPAVPFALQWGPGLGDLDAGTGRYAVKARGLYLTLDGSVGRLNVSAIAKQPTYQNEFGYAGVDDHYFMSVALKPGPAKVTFQPVAIPAPVQKDPPRELMSYTIQSNRADRPITFFVGPKDFDVLAGVDRELVRAIDFGMFAIIVVPLLRSLKWVNGFVGNYGWSIIILTVLINALMFPLRHKSVVSMRRMQEIQPEAKAIQDRYAKLKATDPAKQKMNQELMALYRERGVNPASGCVPMLLTLPVLFAFYALLTTAIELRGAPFVGWIHDLSLPDPLYVTPVAMGLSQFWQQWITPQAGVDPAQQKMMMFMPLMFMFFFLWAPSGVAVYWLVSNVWGIGQTYLTNYLIGPPNVRTARPAAERRLKRVGAGKTEAAAREQ